MYTAAESPAGPAPTMMQSQAFFSTTVIEPPLSSSPRRRHGHPRPARRAGARVRKGLADDVVGELPRGGGIPGDRGLADGLVAAADVDHGGPSFVRADLDPQAPREVRPHPKYRSPRPLQAHKPPPGYKANRDGR